MPDTKPIRLLVCGGRDYDKFAAWNWLEANVEDYVSEVLGFNQVKVVALIHGGARGADEGAKEWGESEHATVVEYRADWKKHGRAAGPTRNQRMLDEGKPDIVIAFPGGRGTKDMVSRAKMAGVPVAEVRNA